MPVTISIGIAVTLERGDSASASLSRADEALYEAKASGPQPRDQLGAQHAGSGEGVQRLVVIS